MKYDNIYLIIILVLSTYKGLSCCDVKIIYIIAVSKKKKKVVKPQNSNVFITERN